MPAESKFSKKFKSLFRPPDVYLRIESKITPGFPDVLIIRNKIAYLIELKSEGPISTRLYSRVRPLQISFHQNWKAENLRTYFLISYQGLNYALINGKYANDLAAGCLEKRYALITHGDAGLRAIYEFLGGNY